MKKLMKAGWVMKLRMNMRKTKYMEVTTTTTKTLKNEIRNMRG